jgi:hypothetical protein
MIRHLATLPAWLCLIARLTWDEDMPRFVARGVYVSAIKGLCVGILFMIPIMGLNPIRGWRWASQLASDQQLSRKDVDKALGVDESACSLDLAIILAASRHGDACQKAANR